jgi:hypothetical protein
MLQGCLAAFSDGSDALQGEIAKQGGCCDKLRRACCAAAGTSPHRSENAGR